MEALTEVLASIRFESDTANVPAGFFENKEADAKAHGIAPPKKLTKEEAYADFMGAIAADVKEVEAREQDEAVDAAQERADREAFEQRYAPHPRLEDLTDMGATKSISSQSLGHAQSSPWRGSPPSRCVLSVQADICRQAYDTFMSVVYIFHARRLFLNTLRHLISLAWWK
jgi:hypothetical protein